MPLLKEHLQRKFVWIRRDFVTEGNWKVLVRWNRGATTSLFGIMALVAQGYGPRGTFVHRSDLRNLADLSPALLADSLAVLRNRGFVPLASQLPQMLGFALDGAMVGTGARDSLLLHGRLIASGVWTSLLGRERAVLVALASCLRSLRSTDIEYEEDCDVLFSWLDAADALRIIDPSGETDSWDGEGEWYARRVGHASLGQLAGLTGLDRSNVSRALQSLTAPGSAGLVRQHVGLRQRTIYHLPPCWWDM
jgi:hypothetical protein